MKVRINHFDKEPEVVDFPEGVDAFSIICEISLKGVDDFYIEVFYNDKWINGAEYDYNLIHNK